MNGRLPERWPRLLVLVSATCLGCSGGGPSTRDSGGAPVGSDVQDIEGLADSGSDPGSDGVAQEVSEEPGGPQWPGIVPEVTASPFAVRFLWEGREVARLDAGDRGALWVDEGGPVARLQGSPVRVADASGVTLRYDLDDGRSATVRLSPVEEGAVQVRFEVSRRDFWERLALRFAVGPDEAFYGLTERPALYADQGVSWRPGQTDGLDLRGREGELFVYPTVAIYSPMILSSAGWILYVEEDWPGYWDVGSQDPDAVVVKMESDPESPSVTFRVIPGPTPLEAVERYARTVGLPLLPPRWAFGPWRWRDNHHDLPAFYDGTPFDGPYNSMVVEDVLMMEALGIPCDLYWVDRPWGPGPFGYESFAWDEDRLPNPREMIRWLARRNIRFMLWIAPWACGPDRDEAASKGYLVPDELPGNTPYCRLLDLTNPAAVTWWQDALRRVMDDGVVGFKLDRGEERPPDGLVIQGSYFDGTSYREGKNQYPLWYVRAVDEAWRRAGVPEFVTMPRAGWRGSSRYGIFWGGDIAGGQWGLRSAIIAAQRAAVMNFPVWGSDTCGYGGAFERENCQRWLAFSAFTPLMEVGPTNDAAPWSFPPEGVRGRVDGNGYDYTPEYAEDVVAAWIFYARLHEDLKDYSYAQARLASERGTPIVRPMAVAFPGLPEYRDLFDQYLYGPDLLVAPVWADGVTERDVHLPPGTWVDAWTGEVHEGPRVVRADASLPRIPLFVRQGSNLDLGDLQARWGDARQRASRRPDLAALVAGETW